MVLEKEDCYAHLWKKKAYDRLKLHLAKEFCALPYMPHSDSAPTYIPRADFVKYLDEYVEKFNINPVCNTLVESASYDEDDNIWKMKTKNSKNGEEDEILARFLVVATGENEAVFIPEVEGLKGFKGDVIHSSEFKSGKAFSGKRVLVAGCGNSGMEIAYDLASSGAKTSISIRNPVVKEPKIVKGNGVVFKDGKTCNFDAIVFATGYRSTAMNWLKDEDGLLLNQEGFPKERFPNHWKGKNGLYSVGLARRGLLGIAKDAENTANDIENILKQL